MQASRKLLILVILAAILGAVAYLNITSELPQCKWGPRDEILNEPCRNYSGGGP